MTNQITTTVGAEEVNTPSETGDTTTVWLERHVENVLQAIADGMLPISTASRIYTYWPVDEIPSPRCLVTIRYNGPPLETDTEFLDRHFTDVLSDMGSHPPLP